VADSSNINAPYIYSLLLPTLNSIYLLFTLSNRPICSLFLVFQFIHFPKISFIYTGCGPFTHSVFCLLFSVSISTVYLRPCRDFVLHIFLLNHIWNRGSPCTLGCNPIYHASWAVAGWFTCVYGPVNGKVVVVVGAFRMCRSFRISSVVSVVGSCGACGIWGGGVGAAVI
jgi:hypothetical protein